MSFWSSKEEQAQEDYENAQKDGSRSDVLDQALHAALSPLYSDAHNKGWDNGVANQPKDD